VAAIIPDMLQLKKMKNHIITQSSTTTETSDKIIKDLKSLEFFNATMIKFCLLKLATDVL
jgi:hypothetical protein